MASQERRLQIPKHESKSLRERWETMPSEEESFFYAGVASIDAHCRERRPWLYGFRGKLCDRVGGMTDSVDDSVGIDKGGDGGQCWGDMWKREHSNV